MDAAAKPDTTPPAPLARRPWAELTLGERVVLTAWRCVGAHLAAERSDPAEQVATGGAGDVDGVMDDALRPPPRRGRLT